MRGTRREVLAGAAAATWLATAPAFAFPKEIHSMNVIVDGLSIRLFRYSNARSGCVPVIYVHGATFPSSLAIGWTFSDGQSWADDLVDAGYDVWGFDFAGYGGSDRYPEMTAVPTSGPLGRSDVAVRQLAEVVQRVRAETQMSRVVLLAHSWGTLVAGRLAAEKPSSLERLVLFGPILRRTGGDSSAIDRLPGWALVTPEEQIKRFREDVPAGQPELITDSMFAPWGAAYLSSDSAASVRTPSAVAVPNGPVADILAARAGRLPYDPGRITCPIAIVRGEWDSRVTDKDVAAFKATLTGCSSFTDAKLERGTHLMHLETGRARLRAATRNALAEAKRAPLDTHAVIFEVRPSNHGRSEYLAAAAALRPLLDEIDGFVSIERFQSTARPGWILSLSWWADEAAVAAWRSRDRHHAAQVKGRAGIFEDYRLRVAHSLFDQGVPANRQPPHPSSYNDPARRRIGYVALVEIIGKPSPSRERLLRRGSPIRAAEEFASLTNPGKSVHLLEFPNLAAVRSWQAEMGKIGGAADSCDVGCRTRTLEVLRDYGMFDRAQAPQYHLPAQSGGAAA